MLSSRFPKKRPAGVRCFDETVEGRLKQGFRRPFCMAEQRGAAVAEILFPRIAFVMHERVGRTVGGGVFRAPGLSPFLR